MINSMVGTLCSKGKFAFTVFFCASILLASSAQAQTILFSEDFEGLVLGEKVDEADLIDNVQDEVYSPDGPEGWTVDRTGVPEGGVLEFRGWNFLSPAWWDEVAG